MTGLPEVCCPGCQLVSGLEVYLGTDDARGVVRQLARCPGTPALRKAALRYVELFSPLKQRLRWGRVEALLTELVDMLLSGTVERGGQVYPVPLPVFEQALHAVLDKPTLRRPLKSHGLLIEIALGLQTRVAAQAETARTTQARGATPVGGHASHKPFVDAHYPDQRQAIEAELREARESLANNPIKTLAGVFRARVEKLEQRLAALTHSPNPTGETHG